MSIEPRTRFSRTLSLDEAGISSFAMAAGDHNPLHHDPEFARHSRYGGIVASGPQTAALLMGVVATHFSRIGPMVGIEFTFRFKGGVPANDPLSLDWIIVRSTTTKRQSGDIVEMRGRIRTSTGRTVVGASGKVLVSRSSPTAL